MSPPPPLPPGLHVVATPIGNPRDITLRALDALAAVDAVLCEDTRRTGRLLAHHGVEARLESFHDHNAARRIPGLVERLEGGARLALVSDAGTPLVSDPGFKLVRACREAGVGVHALPGASAVLAALSVAGLPTDQFHFAGFLPPKPAARRRALEALRAVPGTLVLFETGARIADMLQDAREVLGVRPAALARELTKTYEEVRRGTLDGLLLGVEADPPRGEIVVLIGAGAGEAWTPEAVDAALRERADLKPKAASREVAALAGWSVRDVYQRLQGR